MGAAMKRRFFMMAAPIALASCASEAVWAPDELVQRNIYRHNGPPRLTLFTVLNVGSNNGAHSGLMVNGSQRIIFDPAGTFAHPTIPERNDVVIGARPRIVDYYTDYHARETYYIVVQEVDVSAAVAEQALQMVMTNGPVAKANCTRSISTILAQLPGFESIGVSWFPGGLMEDFARIPNVRAREIFDNDSDNNVGVLDKIQNG